jgi:hypothetical protein
LFLLAAAALLVHGYHPCAEDAEIYLPGVEKILNPQLFPVGQEFFATHASATIFPHLIAFSIRASHLPFATALFIWHVASIFLLLLACWGLARLLFPGKAARWAGVCLIAVLLTIPVAGTALYIMDQYLNPRNLAAFSAIFAVARTLERKYVRTFLWLAFAFSVHPLMAAFAISFCLLLLVMEWFEKFENETEELREFASVGAMLLILPFGISLASPNSPAYHAAALHKNFHYIQLWTWYEQLGAIAPVFLFWWFARIARSRQRHRLALLCRALVIYNLIYFASALVVDLPTKFESLARIQPLRSLHLLYILLFLIIGGLLGESFLRNRIWRWLLVFIPLSIGMFLAQRSLFPASAHVEWPGAAEKNPWAQAFVWIRGHTPINAVFALDPNFMQIRGEDTIGFRCLAERSRLADLSKDAGAVSMFPRLADEWWAQVRSQTPWKDFGIEDYTRLKKTYGVTWVVLQRPGIAGLNCPYQNNAVQACIIP